MEFVKETLKLAFAVMALIVEFKVMKKSNTKTTVTLCFLQILSFDVLYRPYFYMFCFYIFDYLTDDR